jgi:hypothetical protein
MKAIFLSDISTVDGRYLEHFVFDPGTTMAGSMFLFPREKPTRNNWNHWINFWHNYVTTGVNSRCLWGSEATQPIEYGNGTTGKRTMIYNKLKKGGSSTTSQYEDTN